MEQSITKKEALVSLEVYERDTVVKISGLGTPLTQRLDNLEKKLEKRGAIRTFTRKSKQRFRKASRNIMQKMVMEIGLTLPGQDFENDGKQIKRWLDNLRRDFRRKGIKVIWIQEFQKRGAWHMHGAISKPIKEDWLKLRWWEIVGSKQTTHLMHGAHASVIRNRNKMGSYFAKYMGKEGQKTVPPDFEQCGRFWGYSRGFIDVAKYAFRFETEHAKKFLRMAKRWYRAELRGALKIKWKIPSRGFTAWEGRRFFEAYRSRFQPAVFMA